VLDSFGDPGTVSAVVETFGPNSFAVDLKAEYVEQAQVMPQLAEHEGRVRPCGVAANPLER
jgi:hypothetical protein